MRTIALSLMAMLCGTACWSQELTPARRSRVPVGMHAEKTEATNSVSRLQSFHNFLQQKGGLLSVPPAGPAIKLVDATEDGRLAPALLVVKAKFEEYRMCPIAVERQSTQEDPYVMALNAVKDASGVVLLVNGSETGPISTVYPEEHITVLNVTALCKGVTGSGRMQDRIEKLVWRAIGHICGIGAPDGYVCVMQNLKTSEGIDSLPIKFINPISFYKAKSYFDTMGVSPAHKGTYEAAVKQGWAPAPTNDIQKAIWERVKAEKERGPTNPIKIAPPAKK